jgi:glutaredoxin
MRPVPPGTGRPGFRVTLVTRAGCHLCDPARATVRRVAADLGIGWEEIDVDSDPALREQWSDEVPVTLVDGRQHDFWRVDEARLRAALTSPPRSGSGSAAL